MGRDLVYHDEYGWAVYETVSEYYGRVSRFCTDKAQIMQALLQQGIPIQYVEMLDNTNHLPSMMIGGNGMFSTLQIEKALIGANLHVASDPNQAVLFLGGYNTDEEE